MPANPAATAKTLLGQLGITTVADIDIEAIAAFRGAYVKRGNVPMAEARLIRLADRALITINQRETNKGKIRFSIGHELGHFELHRDSISFAYCSSDDMNDWRSRKRRETEANQFSAEILMPDFLFLPLCHGKIPDMNLMTKLATAFRVSLTAASIRFLNVTKEAVAIVFSMQGITSWSIRNANFPFTLKRGGEPVHESSVAFKAFRGEKIPHTSDTVPAHAWLKDRRIDSDSMINEATFFSKRYDLTLTLLWFRDGV